MLHYFKTLKALFLYEEISKVMLPNKLQKTIMNLISFLNSRPISVSAAMIEIPRKSWGLAISHLIMEFEADKQLVLLRSLNKFR